MKRRTGMRIGVLTAGGGDMILIPEIEYDEEVIEKYLKRRIAAGKIKFVHVNHSLITRARSIDTNFGDRV
jgi:hypothetical protein